MSDFVSTGTAAPVLTNLNTESLNLGIKWRQIEEIPFLLHNLGDIVFDGTDRSYYLKAIQ